MFDEKSETMCGYWYASSPCPLIIAGQDLIDAFHIYVLADMSSQLVVLLVFEISEALGAQRGTLSHMFAQQVLNDGCIVKEAVNVGADAMISLEDGLVSIADTLMNLLALTLLTIELERHLTGGLLLCHRGVDGQQAQTRQTTDATLDAFGVVDSLS